MARFHAFLQSFVAVRSDERGQTMAEYAVVLAVIVDRGRRDPRPARRRHQQHAEQRHRQPVVARGVALAAHAREMPCARAGHLCSAVSR